MKKNENKKITVIFSISPIGNAISDYFNELAKLLVKNNYRVVVIFYGFSDKFSMPASNEDLIYLVWPNFRPTKIKDFIFFVKIIRKYNPDLTFSNFSSTNIMGICSYLFGVKNRLNYLHTSPVQLDLDSQKSRLKLILLYYRKKMVYSLHTFFLTNSEGTKADFIKIYNIPNSKIEVKSYLLKKSNSPYLDINARKNQIIIVGRLDISKGHIELIKCFKSYVNDKKSNSKLIIAGNGCQREILKDFVVKNNLENQIIFLGNVPYSQIGNVLSESLVHISASYEEALGLVNIEALKEGTPILCTSTNGSRSILNVKQNGVFFDISNHQSFSDSLDEIFNNWKSYSTGALESFETQHSFDALGKHFMFINSLINK